MDVEAPNTDGVFVPRPSPAVASMTAPALITTARTAMRIDAKVTFRLDALRSAAALACSLVGAMRICGVRVSSCAASGLMFVVDEAALVP